MLGIFPLFLEFLLCYILFHCIFKSFCFLLKFILLWYWSCHIFPSNSLLSFPVQLYFSLFSAHVSFPHQSPSPFYTFVNSCQDPADLNTQPPMHPPPTINLSSSCLFPTRARPCAHPYTHKHTNTGIPWKQRHNHYLCLQNYLLPPHRLFITCIFLPQKYKKAMLRRKSDVLHPLSGEVKSLTLLFSFILLIGVGPGAYMFVTIR